MSSEILVLKNAMVHPPSGLSSFVFFGPLKNIFAKFWSDISILDEVEERVPPLKVPKLKIRLGRIREESVNDVEKSTNLVQNIVPHEMTRLKFNCGSEASRQSQIAGAERDRKMTIVIPKSLVTNSCVSPCNTNNSISAVSSNAQFSPTSGSTLSCLNFLST